MVGRRALIGAAVAAIAVLMASCDASGPDPSQSPGRRAPSAPAAGAPSTPAAAPSPFTGLPTDPAAPVLAVKIGNAHPARPQTGLAAADLVYIEPVEAGISRFVAVYQSEVAPVVGPVRSVRRTDLQLLANFGHPVLAFSGAAPELWPRVRAAPIIARSAPGRAFFRTAGRNAPHNLYAHTAPLLVGAPPVDIGFRFGPAPPGGEPISTVTVGYTSTEIGIHWSAERQRWLFRMGGEPLRGANGNRPSAATVVLQRVPMVATPIRDANGAVSPFAKTVGSGRATVLRNGRAFDVRWSRPSRSAPTVFTRPSGQRMTFARGPVWVVLLPAVR